MLINLGIIDFNVGNLRSLLQVFNGISSLRYNIIFIKNENDFNKIDKLILPGQSSIFSCLKFLKKNNLFYSLINFSNNKPVLGICVGKQIFFSKSEEENNLNSLNFFKGYVKKFKNSFFKIPQIGWNKVKLIKKHFLLNNLSSSNYFYFSHSFYVLPENFEYIYGLTDYGVIFSSIFIKKNIFLLQFHPEKSSLSGIKLIYNFSIWDI